MPNSRLYRPNEDERLKMEIDQLSIFADLKANISKEKSLSNSCHKGAIARSVFASCGTDIFVWDASQQSVLTTNLQNKFLENEAGDSYQALSCTHPPLFDVEYIEFNNENQPTLLLLSGSKGVTVMELPRKWGSFAQFESGKKFILCRTVAIAEKFLSSNPKIYVKQCAWHPGSPNGSHLLMLTSDNFLRLYQVSDEHIPVKVFQLCSTPSRVLGTAAALGETPAAFDFGPALDVTASAGTPAGIGGGGNNFPAPTSFYWPVFILFGNGDVYLLLTNCLSLHHQVLAAADLQVRGPLRMHPAAEDNYGVDACSIACLPTSPPVLAIATCTGRLYHCVVLDAPPDDEPDVEEPEAEEPGAEEPGAGATDVCLYVYESVELELGLRTFTRDTDDVTTRILIHKDPAALGRYHCSHAAGVHTVLVPWLSVLHKCASHDDVGSLAEFFSQDRHSIVEHLICTRPLPTSEISPIQGLCVFGQTEPLLMCILHDLECLTLPLNSRSQIILHQLDELAASSSVNPDSTVEKGTRSGPTYSLSGTSPDAFYRQIVNVLARDCSQPILKSNGSGKDASAKEIYELLCRSTQVLREQYLAKQTKAKELLDSRERALEKCVQLQEAELSDLELSKDALVNRARELAERYEDAQDRHDIMLSRLQICLRTIATRVPVLSTAEENMAAELEKFYENIRNLNIWIKQVKRKEESLREKTGVQSSSALAPLTPPKFASTATSGAVTPLKWLSSQASPGGNRIQTSRDSSIKLLVKNETEALKGMVEQVQKLRADCAAVDL